MPDERQAITARLPIDLYEWLRERSYKRRKAQNELIIEALELYRHTPAWSDPDDEASEGGQ